jgi:hypothetical protein
MRRNTNHQLSIALTIFLVLGACRKDSNPRLPDATSSGANTAGVLLNGELWRPVPYSCSVTLGLFPRALKEIGDFGYFPNDKILSITIDECGKDRGATLTLRIANYNGPGKYVCSESGFVSTLPNYSDKPVSYMKFLTGQVGDIPRSYVSGYGVVASITITKLDTLSKPAFVSGTFEGKLQEIANKQDTIRMTSGRFDIINKQ